jgi:hypothetical protein
MGGGFLGIGGAGQHDIGACSAAVAVRTDIDDEPARRDVDLVGAEQEENVERAGRHHLPRAQSALPRHKAEIERADARGCRVQDAIAVPAVLDGAELDRRFGRQRRDRRAVRARESVGADNEQRVLGLAHRVGEAVAADIGQRFRAGADIIIGIGERRF